MNKILSLTFTILFTSFAFGQSKIEIQKGKTFSKNKFGTDVFYFVHQTFADGFYMTDLYKQLSNDEMYSILENAYYSISKKDKVLAIIKQDEGPDARLAFNIIMDSKIGDLLVLATNFNSKTRIFEKKVDRDNSIYRWYVMKKDKLVYRKDLYSEEAETKNRNESTQSLIDMYLFDDNFDNDKKVKPLIDDLLNSETENDTSKLFGYLYLGEYWLLQKDLNKAEASIKKLEAFFNSSQTIPKGYKLIINMAKTEFEMMKRFSNRL